MGLRDGVGARRAPPPHRIKEESIMRVFHVGVAALATLAVAPVAAQSPDPNLARSLAATCAN